MNDQMEKFRRTMEDVHARLRSKFQIVESLDMRTRAKTYRLYKRGQAGRMPPIEAGFESYEAALARARQLEDEEKS